MRIDLADEAEGIFVGPGGERLARSTGTHFEHLLVSEVYIRFEAEGENGRIFLQPVFNE